MAAVADIEGIDHVYACRLKEAGIATTADLLWQGASPEGRRAIAARTGIGAAVLLEWVSHVDLARIQGVGWEYADLLEEAGVDTVPELARRDAESLHRTLSEINEAKGLVRRLPTAEQVSGWVAEAKTLPPVVTVDAPTGWRAKLPPLRRRPVPADPGLLRGVLSSGDTRSASPDQIERDLVAEHLAERRQST